MNKKNNPSQAELFDTHAHLGFKQLKKNIADVIERAEKAGVTRIVSIGAGDDIEGNDMALEVARAHENVWATVGVHPHDASLVDDRVLEYLAELSNDAKVVAWGEIGLDFYRDHSPRDTQKKVFWDQLKLARELDLPVIIHDRDAHTETMDTLKRFFRTVPKSSSPVGIMHCFSGDAAMAREIIDLDFIISIPGVVTFRNARKLVEVVKETPIEKMVIETDCPFLTPEPHRGKKNEPAYVRFVAEKIAEIKDLAFEDVARITTANAMDVYRLDSGKKKPALTYEMKGNLYLNISNKCNNKCTFCPKHTTGTVKGHYLLLDKEPDADRIIAEIRDPEKYPEVVFVGLGEPTLRIKVLKKTAKWLKSKGARVRLDTDGLANMVYGRDVTADLKGLIDAVSVSLNAPDAKTYEKLCRPSHGQAAYYAVLDFLKDAKKNIPEVTATVVALPGLDVEACRKVAEDIGVKFRVRKYIEPDR